jgi:hypothetical protein
MAELCENSRRIDSAVPGELKEVRAQAEQ